MSSRFAPTLLVCVLSLVLGCQADNESQVSDRSSETSPAESHNSQIAVGDAMLVTLKVPNMT